MSAGRSGTIRIRVRFGETDAAGIVFYATYFTWFDAGTSNLIRVPGVASVDADGRPTFPLPIIEAGAQFVAPVRADQELDLISTVATIGTSSLRIEHDLRALDGSVIARGFEQRVFVRFHAGSLGSQPIPPDLRAHLTGASEPG